MSRFWWCKLEKVGENSDVLGCGLGMHPKCQLCFLNFHYFLLRVVTEILTFVFLVMLLFQLLALSGMQRELQQL